MPYPFEPELLGDGRELDEPPARRLPKIAAIAAVMALFAAGLWFAYWEGTRRAGYPEASEAPLIRADARPMMVRPASPGGLKVPDRNMLIYEPNQRMVEHLLPPPEEPMARPGDGAAARPTSTPAAASAAPSDAVAAAPKADAPAATAAQPAAPAHGGEVRLQLASVRSAEAARLEWDRIRRRNADLLGTLSASPVRTDLGDKGVYWRIETGPLANLAASRICNALRQRNFGCIVVR
jgi:SPOR domain